MLSNSDMPALGPLIRACETIERRWFLESYFPDYHLIMELMSDCTEEVIPEMWTPTGRSKAEPRPEPLTVICSRHSVSVDWFDRRVAPLMGLHLDTPPPVFPRLLGIASNRFAAAMAKDHPKMPLERIVQRVREIVPSAQTHNIRRWLIAQELFDTRRESNRAVMAQRQTAIGLSDDFLDSLYTGDEHAN